MTLDWLTAPLFQYALLAVAMTACLVLFLSSKFEVSAVRRRAEENGSALHLQIREMEQAMAELGERITEVAERPAPAGWSQHEPDQACAGNPNATARGIG